MRRLENFHTLRIESIVMDQISMKVLGVFRILDS
jgi:hypothetical protein